MKTLFFLLLLFVTHKMYAQDTARLFAIDRLVESIDQSNIKPQHDSIFNNHPELGLNIKTYLTALMADQELIKYIDSSYITRIENGVSINTSTSVTFYFEHNKLIKVKDLAKKGASQQLDSLYFADEKCFYNTSSSGRAAERAVQLIKIANIMLDKILKR